MPEGFDHVVAPIVVMLDVMHIDGLLHALVLAEVMRAGRLVQYAG